MATGPIATLLGIFIASVTTFSIPVSFPISTQVGAAAASQGSGSCLKDYLRCSRVGPDPFAAETACHDTWKACVKKKCQIITSGTNKSCPKDQDCQEACTEYATSEYGLLSCCLGDPSLTNRCPKLVDHICNPGTPDSSFLTGGKVYKEGDTIPSKNPISAGPNVDAPMEISPSLTYPQGTKVDGGGMTTKLPLSDPEYPTVEIHPYDVLAFPAAENDTPPPEYRPLQSANPTIEALAFKNDAYVSSNTNVPPGGPDYTLGGGSNLSKGVTSLSSGSFDNSSPLPSQVPSIALSPVQTRGISPISSEPSNTTFESSGQTFTPPPASPLQQFWGRITSLFNF